MRRKIKSGICYGKLWAQLETRNLTRRELGRECNISPNTIAKIGRNAHLDVRIILRICNFLNCRPADIVTVTNVIRGEMK